MNFEINKNFLNQKLNHIDKIIFSKNKNIYPILFNIQKNCLILTAKTNNSEFCIKIDVKDLNAGLKVNKIGEFVTDIKQIIKKMRSFYNEKLIIEKKDKEIIGYCGWKITINELDKTYHNVQNIDLEEKANFSFNVSQKLFFKAIKGVKYAVDQNNEGSIFEGINIVSDKKSLELITTDTYRLGYSKINIDGGQNSNVTVPVTFLSELENVFSKINEDEKITLEWYNKKIAIRFANYYISNDLFEKKFHDCSGIIKDATYKNKVILEKEGFLKILQRINYIDKITLNFYTKKDIEFGTIIATDENEGYIGNYENNLLIDEKSIFKIKGDDLKIILKNKYLIDALKNGLDDKLIFWYKDFQSPVKIEWQNNNDKIKILGFISPIAKN